MNKLTTQEVAALQVIRKTIRDEIIISELSSEVAMFIYDQIYLPVNNILAKQGYCKYDSGEIS